MTPDHTLTPPLPLPPPPFIERPPVGFHQGYCRARVTWLIQISKFYVCTFCWVSVSVSLRFVLFFGFRFVSGFALSVESLHLSRSQCCTVWVTRVLLPHKFKQQHPKNVPNFVEGKGQSQLLAVILNTTHTPHTHTPRSVCLCVCVCGLSSMLNLLIRATRPLSWLWLTVVTIPAAVCPASSAAQLSYLLPGNHPLPSTA